MQAFKPSIASLRSINPTRAFSTSPISRFTQSTLKMGVIQIKTAEEFKTKVEEAKGPIVVDWFATWCGPCKAISPIIEKLSDANTNVAFYKVDVDELADVAANNGIAAMPTFNFYNGGEKVETVKGANPPGIQAALKKITE